MQSESFDLFRPKTALPVRRSRTHLIERLIAAVFLITLLISSGVFLKASNAADGRVQANKHRYQSIAPGTLGTTGIKQSLQQFHAQQISDDMDNDSCELKSG